MAVSADRLSVWLSGHWLALINVALAIYIGLPFLAPVLDKLGHPFAAQIIYSTYRALCHELPQRSYFLFGELKTSLAWTRGGVDLAVFSASVVHTRGETMPVRISRGRFALRRCGACTP